MEILLKITSPIVREQVYNHYKHILKIKDNLPQYLIVEQETIIQFLLTLYVITKEKSFSIALNKIKFFSNHPDFPILQFIKLLTELEASGTIKPAIHLAQLYQSIIDSISSKTTQS